MQAKGCSPLAIAGDLAFPPGLLLLAPHPHKLPHILVLPKLVLQGGGSTAGMGRISRGGWAYQGGS
jgi:hypothetical protein